MTEELETTHMLPYMRMLAEYAVSKGRLSPYAMHMATPLSPVRGSSPLDP